MHLQGKSGRRRGWAGVAVLAFAGSLICSSRAGALSPTLEELNAARQFAADKLCGKDPAGLPFSFVYDGKSSSELLKTWQRKEAREDVDAARTKRVIEYVDPQSRLQLRCEAIEYRDFPVVEWTLYFRNASNIETPILENVQALDATWQRSAEAEFVLHHAAGSQANRSDYGPRETPLPAKSVKRFAGAGGRPTNVDWSYFNLQWGQQGLIVVVGWPGQWAGEFARDEARGIRIRAGQELVHARLLPGEEIRTPLMVLQFWQGDCERSQNLWRRWMMAHSMPKPGGKLPPPQFVASSSRAYGEMIKANQQNQIMHIDRYLEEGLKLDYWWMDAGWYPQEQGWPQVGTWEVDRRRFPHGFRPISDHAHSKGVKILVWFEPERVMPGTWLYENHPEWLLTTWPGQKNPMVGLRSWSSKTVGGSDPCVTHNPTSETRTLANIRWEPGRLSFHPGAKGQYSVVRFTVPETGSYAVHTTFLAIDQSTTTDVHVLTRGRPVFDGWIHLNGQGKQAKYDGTIAAEKGDVLDSVVGWGNGTHVCDSTGLEIRLDGPAGRSFDAAKEFGAERNPAGPWSYGYLKPGPAPDSSTFSLYDRAATSGEGGTRLLDLGNPAARRWLTEHVDRLLTEQGIDLYRQDFNMDPLAFWRAADAPDRQGITENKHVCGYLAYWDTLRQRHPDMLIDSCASGGRRNDLETMRCSVPLWRSDYAYEPIGHQCMTYGISLWLPYHGTGTVASASAAYYGGGATAIEPYAFWSNAAPSLGSGIDLRERKLDYDALRRLYHQWRQLSQFYYADYYPLTPYSQDNREWIAWQFNDPERGQGAVQAFRRAESPVEELRLRLRDLDPEATYAVTVFDRPEATKATGRELMTDGLRVVLSVTPAAAVILYSRRR
jgi:alpha-galactosidase